MSEHWSLIDFQNLTKSILNGNRSIQDPISISNKRRDTVSKISFLNLLLSYNNINKDNILDVLANIYSRFQNNINDLKRNEIVQTMMDSINQEWYDPDYMFIISNPINDDFFDTMSENKPRYDRSCKLCEEIKHLSTLENNIPLTQSVTRNPSSLLNTMPSRFPIGLVLKNFLVKAFFITSNVS